MRQFVRATCRRLGFDIVRYSSALPDLNEEENKILFKAGPFTMTSVERMAALLNAVNYIAKNNIPGDIAECGVWRGGSMMVVALALLSKGDRSRTLYLYDTYEGMSVPEDCDKDIFNRKMQPDEYKVYLAGLEDVRKNMLSTGYPEEKMKFIKGKVEDTIPATIPAHLSLLRLDTDWYESTKHELTHMYPLLDSKGILILDDYGHWQGARKATDEYFQALGGNHYLHRVDYSARILVKNGD